MSAPRFELHSPDPETGRTTFTAFTDSPTSAERWERNGGVAIDTRPEEDDR